MKTRNHETLKDEAKCTLMRMRFELATCIKHMQNRTQAQKLTDAEHGRWPEQQMERELGDEVISFLNRKALPRVASTRQRHGANALNLRKLVMHKTASQDVKTRM